uniref:Pco130820 n=1 Tax=Arundo donax TaxID=35708 RepID=A0A0A9EJK6_ARUDO
MKEYYFKADRPTTQRVPQT